MSALFHLFLCGRTAAEWVIKMKRDAAYENYSSQDKKNAEHLLRFELQLHRPAIREHSKRYLKSENDNIVNNMAQWRNALPSVFRNQLEVLFGTGMYVTQDMARDALESCFLTGKIAREDYNETIDYLDSIQELKSVPDAMENMESSPTAKRVLRKLRINSVVLPDSLVTERERPRFPIPPLYELFTVN